MPRLVILSDTHSLHDRMKCKIPDGDILIHCGDCTNDIGRRSLREFLKWWEAHPHKNKVLIAGNHDGAFEKWYALAYEMVRELSPSTRYLQDSDTTIMGLNFWGSPVTPAFCNWYFNCNRGDELKRHWNMIPDDTDVLITHGPAHGTLDKAMDGYSCGCHDLKEAVARIKPRLHCFGHIHFSYGCSTITHPDGKITNSINASICGENYEPTRPPFIIDL